MAQSNLLVIRNSLEGSLGKALMPIAARMLLEDGARWSWFRHSAGNEMRGESLKALVNDGIDYRDRIAANLKSDGVPQYIIDQLLGTALEVSRPESATIPTAKLDDMLRGAYPNLSYIDTTRAMYSILSQFVHATPISNWHIHRDIFPSLSAPIYAVSLESAVRGFERIASITLPMMGIDLESLEQPLKKMRKQCAMIIQQAILYHFLG
ncbi:MAG: hypothetical protein OXI96_06435 [Acidimicrobiaceae bacterium]|nr:hypothetical protein [Acidimicrobiaceae bacterium]